MKKKIGDILLQIIPVMIGVYLGFVVSNRADTSNRKVQTDIFMSTLLSEMESNKQKVESVVAYHEMVRDSSQYYSNPQVKAIRPGFFKGTRTLKLSNSAYHTGLQTGIINALSISQIQAINQLYTTQNDYNEYSNMLLAGLINRDFSDNEESMKAIARYLAITMTDVVIKERDLLKGYTNLKEVLVEK